MKKNPSHFALYEASVQEPEFELKLFERIYTKQFGEKPLSIREDFCASFLSCVTWVKGGKDRKAIGVDLSDQTLRYGFEHHFPKLTVDQRQRLHLILDDVLKVKTQACHMILATNFSICFLKERKLLLSYFKNVRKSLSKKGLFIMDLLGGTEAELEDYQTKWVPMPSGKGRFQYIWEQESFNPITRETKYAIHFQLKGQKLIRRAFTYDWRLWTIPEVKDVMFEAGFSNVDVYWEGDDKEGSGNGIFKKAAKAENCQSWICYISAS